MYDGSGLPLICSHSHNLMDALGDYPSQCSHYFGTIHRYNTLRKCLARDVFKAAGLAYQLEVPFLIPDTQHRPADILVEPSAPLVDLPAALSPTMVLSRAPSAGGTQQGSFADCLCCKV